MSLERNLILNHRANSDGDSTHTYIDLDIVNNSSSYVPQPVIFQQSNLSNIVDKINDYYMSVVKWSFNANIPVIIPKMDLNTTTNPINYDGKTTYYLNIGYGASPSTASFVNTDAECVIFDPENLYIAEPKYKPESQIEVNNNEFYYIYTVENFLKMVNKSLQLVYDKKKAEYPTELDSKQVSPLFVWDVDTNTIKLIVSNQFVEGLNTNTFFISFNTDLYNLFDTFPSKCLSFTTNPIYGTNFIFSVNNNYDYNSIQYNIPTTNNYLTLYTINQQSSSVPSWSPVSNIVFTTNSMPINPEISGGTQYLGKDLKSSNAVQNVILTMTDFTIPMTSGVEYSRALLYYVPSSEYRLIDCVSNSSLNRITMQIFWKDKLNFFHFVNLKQGANASVKILFRKKTFNGL